MSDKEFALQNEVRHKVEEIGRLLNENDSLKAELILERKRREGLEECLKEAIDLVDDWPDTSDEGSVPSQWPNTRDRWIEALAQASNEGSEGGKDK